VRLGALSFAAVLALLAPAAHAGNPIQTENLQAGSGTISLAAAPPRAIEGYTSQVSHLPGGSVAFHVATNPAEHQWSWGLDGYRFNQGFDVPVDPRLQRFMENGLDDLGRPAAPIAVSAGHIPRGILVRVSLYPDPRVHVEVFRHGGAAPFALTAGGVVRVCPSVTTACVDHPRMPGTYLYEAVTQDQWSSSFPTASKLVVALRLRRRRRHPR